eukprot:g39032.t1
MDEIGFILIIYGMRASLARQHSLPIPNCPESSYESTMSRVTYRPDQAKVQMLDSLLDIEVAYSLLKGGKDDDAKNPIDINYEKLHTEIK